MVVYWDNAHKVEIVKLVIDILSKGKKLDLEYGTIITEPTGIAIGYFMQFPTLGRQTMMAPIFYEDIAKAVFDYDIVSNPIALRNDTMDLNNIDEIQKIKLGKFIMERIWYYTKLALEAK